MKHPGNCRVRFAVATDAEDGAIRRLLRETPMEGEVRLCWEREPDFFRGSRLPGAESVTIVAFDRGRLICMGSCTSRSLFVDGQPERVGYLSNLRLDSQARGRFDILRRGYRFFRDLNPAGTYLTSIAADNERSIRFLERGLPGMPRYELAGKLSTVSMSVPASGAGRDRLRSRVEEQLAYEGLRVARGGAGDAGEIALFLNRQAARVQFGSVWSGEQLLELSGFGLGLEDFRLVFKGDDLVGCAAVWDQRSFKQTVVRGYGPRLRWLRPFLNSAARFLPLPRLPGAGSILKMACVSPLAFEPGWDRMLSPVLGFILAGAAERGLEYLLVSLPRENPLIEALRRDFCVREYETRIYAVRWRAGAPGPRLDGRPLGPDLAFL